MYLGSNEIYDFMVPICCVFSLYGEQVIFSNSFFHIIDIEFDDMSFGTLHCIKEKLEIS